MEFPTVPFDVELLDFDLLTFDAMRERFRQETV